MTDVTFAPGTRTNRVYGFGLPLCFPGFGVGIAIRQMKNLGVWDEIPTALKRKIKMAKGTWTGLRTTKADLDSIPDHAWERIAAHLGLKWKYATDPTRRPRSDTAAQGHQSSPLPA